MGGALQRAALLLLRWLLVVLQLLRLHLRAGAACCRGLLGAAHAIAAAGGGMAGAQGQQ